MKFSSSSIAIKGRRFTRVPSSIYSREHLSKIISSTNKSRIIIKKTREKSTNVKKKIGSSNSIPKVYVLELEGGFIYVGKSEDVKGRINNHMSGKYKPNSINRI